MSDPKPTTPSALQPRPGEATALAARIEAYAEARAAAHICHDLARTLSDPDRDPVEAEAEAARLEQDATARHAEIMAAVDDLTHATLHAVPDPRLPVCTWRKDVVEIRATLPDGSRAVRVRYTPAQAIAAGAALIACGAVADTRTGGTLGPILPPWPTDTTPADLGDPAVTAPNDPASGAGTTHSLVEHDCQTAATLVFRGHYGAPGVGQAWDCTECGRGWSRLGDRFYPAEDGAHILTLKDCI
jgi:hypothetical protein